jgi:hypothetical protein
VNSTNIRRSAVALVATAGLLAGCGDSDTDPVGSTTDAPAATTAAVTATPIPTLSAKDKKELASPNGKWATSVCNGLVKGTLELQPPNVDPANPASTRTSLISFFKQVGDQLEGQVKVLKDAGKPPTGIDTYKSSIRRLEKIKRSVRELGENVEESNATSEADITAVVAGLGKQMNALSSYGGPVVDLSKNKDLAKVLSAEPACAKFL